VGIMRVAAQVAGIKEEMRALSNKTSNPNIS
jgi:hypothetical protein